MNCVYCGLSRKDYDRYRMICTSPWDHEWPTPGPDAAGSGNAGQSVSPPTDAPKPVVTMESKCLRCGLSLKDYDRRRIPCYSLGDHEWPTPGPYAPVPGYVSDLLEQHTPEPETAWSRSVRALLAEHLPEPDAAGPGDIFDLMADHIADVASRLKEVRLFIIQSRRSGLELADAAEALAALAAAAFGQVERPGPIPPDGLAALDVLRLSRMTPGQRAALERVGAAVAAYRSEVNES